MGGFVVDGAVPGNPRRAEAIALIRAEADDVAPLDRLCRAVVNGLHLAGATVALTGDAARLAGGSGEWALRVGEVEFATGEGPCAAVLQSRRPLLVADLRAPDAPRWPAYTPAVLELGVVGLFALPLHVGAIQLGALILVSDEAVRLVGDRFATALTFAEIATETLLDNLVRVDHEHRPGLDLDTVLDAHAEVYQAQGMIMIQLGIGLADALARLRARAFSQDRSLTDVARDVLTGRDVIEGDE